MKLFTPAILILLLTFTATGCSTVEKYKNNKKTEKEEDERIKKNYLALKSDVANGVLKKNMTAQSIKEKYGPPSDVFYSNSSVSSFQTWTYNIAKDKLSNESFIPVLLYINNEKLISWKY